MYNKNLNKMNKETLRMQMLAGIITEGQYKKMLNEENENMFNDNNKAFGILFRKTTPDDYLEEEYTWIPDNVEKFMEFLGYGENSYDVATEVTSFAEPGTEDDLIALGNPNIPVENITIGMYRKSIENEFEK